MLGEGLLFYYYLVIIYLSMQSRFAPSHYPSRTPTIDQKLTEGRDCFFIFLFPTAIAQFKYTEGILKSTFF